MRRRNPIARFPSLPSNCRLVLLKGLFHRSTRNKTPHLGAFIEERLQSHDSAPSRRRKPRFLCLPRRLPPAASKTAVNKRAADKKTLLFAFLWLLLAQPLLADTWIDAYDSPETTWKSGPQQPHVRLVRHERVRVSAVAPKKISSPEGPPPKGTENSSQPRIGAERLVYESPPGMSAWFWREIPAAAVIDELRLRADIRATGPGTLLAAEVILPRSVDPESGQPLRLVVRSIPMPPTRAGDAHLLLENLPQLVRHRVRAMRVAPSPEGKPRTVDERGAYLTRIGIVAPGDIRARQLWIKQIRVESLVAPSQRPASLADESLGDLLTGPSLKSPRPTEAIPSDPGGRIEPTRVTLDNDGFRIDGALFFPRVWRWRGESFEELAGRGFNTVWIDTPPTEALLAEATTNRLRLIAPPPEIEAAKSAKASWAPVLAWALRGLATAQNMDSHLAVVERSRDLPKAALRPLLVATDEPAEWSRIADGLLIATRGSRVTAQPDAMKRLRQALAESRPGTPLLALVDTDIGPALQRQLDALIGEAVTPGWLPPSDVAGATHAALAAGCRGIVYTSTEPLDGPDDPTVAAADWIELSNAHLRLTEPWLVGPRPPIQLSGTGDGLLLERQGVRLALAPRLGIPPTDSSHLTLPGVGQTHQLFRLTPAGVHHLSSTRVAGGLQIDRPGGMTPGSVIVGNDPRIFASLQRYTASTGPRAAASLIRFTKGALARADTLERDTGAEARRRLGEANLAIARRDFSRAYDLAYAALETIETANEKRRRIAVTSTGIAESSPLAVLPSTLTDHFGFLQMLAAAKRGPNRLYGGSFEDIDEVRRQGWTHPTPSTGGETKVELIEKTPVHGERRLRLTSQSPQPASLAPRVVSPKVDLAAGELVEVTGWALVTAIPGQEPGLLRVSDTLGGEELALEIGPHQDWRPFRLLRRAITPTTLRLTLAAKGAVTVDLDGVMLRAIEPMAKRVSRRDAEPQRRTN